ncbi:MAG: phospho-sugar mutase, partial [Bacteroidota bacterium]
LIENDEKALIEAFYKDLEFGTGGLRGIMGLGSNRINKYTIGMATQGLANYLIKQFPGEPVHVAIAYDSRINSRTFSETAAKILSANNIHVYLFDDLRPTPELSFAIRELSCKSGIVITASHNPKEYNGYKVYWEDGGQIIAPHDKNIIAEVQAIKSINEIKFNGNPEKIKSIGENIDQIYLNKIKTLSLSPDIIKKNKDLGIVFTPIHGTGVKLVPAALKQIGFENIYHVPEQDHPDGNFPTVHSPNPEENAALDMAIEKAKKEDADLVMATDPDGDRVGIAVKNKKGTFVLLNGNQIASLLIYYLLSQWSRKGMIKGKEYIVKTIVTTELLSEIAKDFNVEIHDVLTGFKYIADKIKTLEGQKHFIGGGEESYGYLIGDFVRDKDAVISCAFIAETAAWAKEQDKTLYELLLDIYQKYGLFVEDLVSVVKKGKAGEEEIREMMNKFRNTPPSTLAGSDVVLIHDYQKSKTVDMISDLRYDINLPKSNVLQFVTKDGAIISVRPSGTEPKIKFYFSVRGELNNTEDYLSERENRLKQIENIKKDLGI